jgi:processive 1,2-diacylglycerol beta-glucosyltransferase
MGGTFKPGIRKPATVVAYTPYSREHAVTWLRIVRPLQAAGIQLLHGSEGGIHPELVSQAEAVIIQREFPGYSSGSYDQIIQRARAEGKPVIYETDDLLLELPPEHPDTAIHYYTAALFPMLQAVFEADLVTTTNPILESYYQKINPNTCVLPNYLDDLLWQPIDVIAIPASQLCVPAKVVIGYMGSTTHITDLEEIAPVLQYLMVRFPDQIQLRFWGGPPPADLQGLPSVEWIPVEIFDYPKFSKYFSQQHCDIFIAPLGNSFFNQCKSPIKFFEYSILGIPGVYSRLAPYEAVIQHGENGMLASSQEEWETSLAGLIESGERRNAMGQKAQESVLKHWRLSEHAYEWVEAYQKAIDDVSSGEKRSPINKTGLNYEQTQIFLQVSLQVQDWLETLQRQAAQQEQTIQNLRTGIEDKRLEEVRRELELTQRQLTEIKQSESWRLITALDKIKPSLYPHGSKRERAVQKVANWLLRERSSNQD